MLKPMDFNWNRLFEEEIYAKKYWRDLCQFINSERQAKGDLIIPNELSVFRAFDLCPLWSTKCVIIGQEPYHHRSLSTGLAYSVPYQCTKYPPMLANIHRALKVDLNMVSKSGNLINWARQGVLLLNKVLTTEEGVPQAHFHKGWEKVTDVVIKALGDDERPKVFMLWGKRAQAKAKLINKEKHLILETSHPSTFNVNEGFLFAKHFSKCNNFLIENGRVPIDWKL